MKKILLLSFLASILSFALSIESHAQSAGDLIKTEISPLTQYGIPKMPVINSTLDPKQDTIIYSTEIMKWLVDVLKVYHLTLSEEQISMMKELLTIENINSIIGVQEILPLEYK